MLKRLAILMSNANNRFTLKSYSPMRSMCNEPVILPRSEITSWHQGRSSVSIIIFYLIMGTVIDS